MNAEELADKFRAKISAAATERQKQSDIASENTAKMGNDADDCRNAMEREVIPFMSELQHCLGEQQFSFASQVELHDHRPVGVTFTIGNGAPTSISTALGHIVVTRVGDSGSAKGVPYVFASDEEPFISNSGDLTRVKIGKLIEMVIDG